MHSLVVCSGVASGRVAGHITVKKMSKFRLPFYRSRFCGSRVHPIARYTKAGDQQVVLAEFFVAQCQEGGDDAVPVAAGTTRRTGPIPGSRDSARAKLKVSLTFGGPF